MVRKGPAALEAAGNTEAAIMLKFGAEIPFSPGPRTDECDACKALHWIGERPLSKQTKSTITEPHKYTTCCNGGQVEVPETYFGGRTVPAFIKHLLTSTDPASTEFRHNIRTYNNALSFTSLGAKIDKSVDGPFGFHCFRISGQLVHNIGTLLPRDDDTPSFAQIFIWGGSTEEEAALRAQKSNLPLNERILQCFQAFFYHHNPYARLFRSARDVLQRSDSVAIRLKTLPKEGRNWRKYNHPTTDEVAMIIEGNSDSAAAPRDIILHTADNGLKRVSDLHTGYLSLRYPILFPYGSHGWDEHFKSELSKRADKKVTNLEFFAYILFQRPDTFSQVLRSARLFQELATDMYVCIEHQRLEWFRTHQREIRADLYAGAVEALGRDDHKIGRPVILPATHIGGPRHMLTLYHDAMAMVRKFGAPSFFITMTANDNWPEIQQCLEPGETAENRPDLVVRAFRLRFEAMLQDVTKHGRLGRCLSYVYTVEFQKRGRPHAHLILIMDPESTPRTVNGIDATVRAQLPDKDTEPELYRAVTTFMLHGPCKVGSACWRDDRCRFYFPRAFASTTTMTDDTYPTYERPDNGSSFVRNRNTYTNQHVVPYNPYLLLKYQCHINVEIPVSIQALKYLYKYITKGSDRTFMSLTAEDEIEVHVDGRFLSACEAIWRMYKYPMAERSPAVTRLAIHLENYQTVHFGSREALQWAVDTGKAERTTLTEFFRLCRENDTIPLTGQSIRTLCYQDIAEYYSWNKDKRKLIGRQRKSEAVARVHYASIGQGERYYLRLLLLNVPGPTSFENLRNVDGIQHETFRAAAEAHGLLRTDRHYFAVLEEAAVWLPGKQLRDLFAIILKHSPPANALALWEHFKDELSDDCKHSIRKADQHCDPSIEMIHALGLARLSQQLQEMGYTLREAGLPNPNLQILTGFLHLADISEITTYSPEDSEAEFADRYDTMNAEQVSLTDAIIEALDAQESGLFFLDGPGGTGKTYVLNALLHHCNAHGISSLAVASSGIAALLLMGGTTSNTGLKIPLDPDETSVCSFTGNTRVGKQLRDVKFIVWDEIAMQHRYAIECVDRSMRDLRDCAKPFGGATVLFSGDFRQTLPVIPGGSIAEQAAASLKSSPLWQSIMKFALRVNVRLRATPDMPPEESQCNENFGKWLLELGSGRLQVEDMERITLQYVEVKSVRPPFMFDYGMVLRMYQDAQELCLARDWSSLGRYYAPRCIITPLNKGVTKVNTYLTDALPGDAVIARSIDVSSGDGTESVTSEILNTFSVSNFPEHSITLKIGMPIILLRNLNISKGLCNGTRMLITYIGHNSLRCQLITGPRSGSSVVLPRITLHHKGNRAVPLPFERYQYPVAPAFCMTINKAQGQSLDHVCVLLPAPVFSHGQLYVALSRCTNAQNVHVCLADAAAENQTLNIVYHPILRS